jgi:lipoprotein-releasing system permease protein
MAEYDSNFVFVPIRRLQELRGTIDPMTGIGNFNSIMIRLKPGADMDAWRSRAGWPWSRECC